MMGVQRWAFELTCMGESRVLNCRTSWIPSAAIKLLTCPYLSGTRVWSQVKPHWASASVYTDENVQVPNFASDRCWP
eukprot:scaffold57321_cov25-Tisochrysis_lutea.AAC.4